jgi:hypothetical protein
MTAPFRSERCPCGLRWEDCPRRNELEFAGAGRPVRPARRSAGRCHSLKRSRPALGHLWAFVAALAVTPAQAYHCGSAFIYRVHLDQCVAVTSALARAYVRPVRRGNIPAARIPLTRHVADADAPPYPLPPAASPAAAPPAQPDDQATLVLPVVEDGAPAIWRLCKAAPNLCKASDR